MASMMEYVAAPQYPSTVYDTLAGAGRSPNLAALHKYAPTHAAAFS